MNTPSSAIPVTIVSTDRKLLCELSWTLSLFGYDVTASCDFSDESPWRRSNSHGLLVLDARSSQEVDEVLATPRNSAFTYRIAIDNMTAESRSEGLILRGADDVVRYPVNTGELLTRLRAGVRRLEFELRLAAREHLDVVSGVLTRHALTKALDGAAAAARRSPTSYMICGIDYQDLICQQYGRRAVLQLAATLGQRITQSLANGEMCGTLGDGLFVALLHRPLQQALQFAESLAHDFGSCDTLVREIRSVPSLSATVAEWNPQVPANTQLDAGSTIWEHVCSYGGNYVVRSSDVQQEIATWRSNMDAGAPFETVIAQDMMEMFPLVLTNEQVDQGYAGAIVGSQGLSLPCIPIVDDAGAMTGALATDGVSNRTSPPKIQTPPTVQNDQPLNELFESFAVADTDHLIVVDADKCPLGYITCEALASLVLDRMDPSNYRMATADDLSVASLIVPVEPRRPTANEPSLAP